MLNSLQMNKKSKKMSKKISERNVFISETGWKVDMWPIREL